MYRCTECKEEFKEKPDYCTCGNDEFEEFTPQKTAAQHEPVKPALQNFDKEKALPIKTFDKAKIFSVIFLCFCIILAIIPWLIKTQKPTATVQKPQKEASKTIPNIENIWKNSPAESAPQKQKTQEQNSIPTPTPEPKAAKVTDNTKPQPKKPQAPQKSTSGTVKTQTKPTTQQSKQEKSTSKQNSTPVHKPKLPQSVLNTANNAQPASQKQKNTQAQIPAASKPAAPMEQPKMNPSEFLNYKGSIRSALLSKLNIAAIQGSGDCAVEFAIDNSGKLINRKFIYKSQNKSVNDEVYLMLMRLPYYKTPPAHYNGEKIKLKFLFNNGYYEITFI